MPKITVHGGPSNAYEGDPHAEPSSSAGTDGPTVELTREEDPHAPAARPGEHAPFFAGLNQSERLEETNTDGDDPNTDGDESSSGLNQPEETDEELAGDGEGEALPEVADEEREAPASSTPRKATKRGGSKA